jgi:Uma2 family endonuclease
VANVAPGVIFADDDDVAPDVVWISQEKWQRALQPDGHLHAAPELVVELLSPGTANTQRDRNIKLKLYSRRGVLEYWIVDWQERTVEVYRREEAMLKHISTLYENDTLQSPHLPGFQCKVSEIFVDVF